MKQIFITLPEIQTALDDVRRHYYSLMKYNINLQGVSLNYNSEFNTLCKKMITGIIRPSLSKDVDLIMLIEIHS